MILDRYMPNKNNILVLLFVSSIDDYPLPDVFHSVMAQASAKTTPALSQQTIGLDCLLVLLHFAFALHSIIG